MQKSRLIEKIAELFNEKKLPLVADVRDESTEDVRVVIEPRSRTRRSGHDDGDPVPADRTRGPHSAQHERAGRRRRAARGRAAGSAAGNGSTIAATVLLRRSRHRRGEIEHRLEVLAGMLIVFLNLDEVIRIIREEDEPKDVLKATFDLTEVQANYILDTRLRSLRRLEEMQLRTRARRARPRSAKAIEALLGERAARNGRRSPGRSATCRRSTGPTRRSAAAAPRFEDMPDTRRRRSTKRMVEREPITVVVSEKGWIRALKGHVATWRR